MAFFSRGKNKIQNPYTYSHMYIDFKEEYKDNKLYANIEYHDFVRLCNSFYKEMSHRILHKNSFFKLPFRLGTIQIIKKKVNLSRNMAIDWKKTVAYKKKIVHLNEHTNGYKYWFKWTKDKALFTNKTYYKLIFTRDNKRDLARLIKSGYDYLEE